MPIPTLLFHRTVHLSGKRFSVSSSHQKCQYGGIFLFELNTLNDEKLFALIKYDNEDVVRYVLDAKETSFRSQTRTLP
jgi:hypothetical protein